MKRTIKYSVIGEVALFLKHELEELRNSRNQLLIDVNTIDDGFKGKDAHLLIEKYKEKIANIDTYIQTMENVQIILEWLSENYKDSHNKANSNLEAYSSLIPSDGVNNNKFSFGLNIDDITEG